MGGRSAHLISVPFHDGLLGVDRGRGPAALLAAAGLRAAETITSPDPTLPEAARVFAVAAHLADLVRAVVADGARPVVVAGDCNSCLGTVAGSGVAGLGVVWLDAHADVDTPDDSRSGSLDAMGLALLTGRGWQAMRAGVPGLAAIDEQDVVLVGVRDVEPGQRERLRRSRIAVVAGGESADTALDGALDVALDALRRRVTQVYLHVDLDVLDPRDGTANRYGAAGGLRTDQLLHAIAVVAARFDVRAAALTAYDPAADHDGRAAGVGARVLAALGAG